MVNALDRRVAFNRGELDERLIVRDDLDILKAGCRRLVNYQPMPQGGVRRRAGTLHVDYARNLLTSVPLASASGTAPNGGVANAILGGTGSLLTTTTLSGAAFVVMTFDFAVPTLISLIDLKDMQLIGESGDIGLPPANGGGWNHGATEEYFIEASPGSGGGGGSTISTPVELTGALKVQYFDGAWHDFGPAVSIGSVLRSRRLGSPAGQGKIATMWRIVIDASGLAGDATRQFLMGAMVAYAETSAVSPVKLRAVSLGNGTTGMMAFTAGNVDIYEGNTRVGSAALPLSANGVALMDMAQSLDTVVVVEKTMPPYGLMRQGSGADWDSRPLAFTDVPVFDFRGDRAGGVDEIQQLHFVEYVNGDTFNVAVEDDLTATIAWAGAASTASALQAALEALPVIGAGNVTCMADGTATIVINFIGAGSNLDWGEVVPKTIKSDVGGIAVSTRQQGKVGGEPKWSATRGYPSAVTFYQQRLWLGGMASLPETVCASRTGDYFSFRIGGRDDAAIDVTLDSEALTAVRRIFAGSSLMFFTSAAEFTWSNEPISPLEPGIKLASRRGIHPSIPPLELDGVVVFVAPEGNEVLAFSYSDQTQKFEASGLSTLAGNIVRQALDMAARVRPSDGDPDELLAVLADGTGAACSVQRAENVAAWWRFETFGGIQAVAAPTSGPMWLAVVRNGRTRIERQAAGIMLDAAMSVAGAETPPAQITGLDHLNGFSARILVAGRDMGAIEVENGTVPNFAGPNEAVQIGLSFDCEIVTMPLELRDNRGRAGSKVRTCGVEVRIDGQVQMFEVRGGGQHWWEMWMRRADNNTLDRPWISAGWAGRVNGLPGADEAGSVHLRCRTQNEHTITAMAISGGA